MRNQNKKKRQDTGFTLIELLAVITIMGILMMVAIPAVSNTINNSKKDTFVTTAQEIANSVKTLWNSDSIECAKSGTSDSKTSGALGAGTYYLIFFTGGSSCSAFNGECKNGLDVIMDNGAKSSFGGVKLTGTVKIEVSSDGNNGNKTTYKIMMADETKHYLEMKDPAELKKNQVQSKFPDKISTQTFDNVARSAHVITSPSTAYYCRVN